MNALSSPLSFARFAVLTALALLSFGASPDLPTADAAPPVITCPDSFPDEFIDQSFTDGTIIAANPGQSFTVGVSGDITTIAVHPLSGFTATLRVYEGEGIGGTELHSQSITATGGSLQTFTMTTPVPVTPGSYTFRIEVSGVNWRQCAGCYAGGIMYSGAGTVANTDLQFQVNIQGGPATEFIDQSFTDGTIIAANPGQSFTAGISGDIQSIAVHPLSGFTATLRIYEGEGIGGTELHNQSITATGGSLQTFALTSPVAVTPGSYTFRIEVSGVNWRQCAGCYAGGIMYSGAGTVANTDLQFQVLIQQTSGSGPAVTAECAGPGGTPVSFSPTVTDDDDPNPSVVCVPASGSLFALGTTTVTCTATDAGGDSSQCTFDVLVEDTTPPDINCPADIDADCVGGSAVVNFSVTATDICDGTVSVTCTPVSGSTFSLGTTTVVCTATDAAGNTAQCTFDVNVVDVTPPVLSACPADITVECEFGGNTVTFTEPTAVDDCDGAVAVVCTPPSGSVFTLGTTTVTCTATDAAGNQSSCSFDVIVVDTTPPEITCSLARTLLWPARRGMIPVGFNATAFDECDGPIGVTVDVFSDEANGAAPFAPDADGTTPPTMRLRAERAYPGNGRVYLIRVTATDRSGNSSTECKAVIVPVMPVGLWIVQVRAAAATAEAQCAASPGTPPASTPNLIHTFTTTVP